MFVPEVACTGEFSLSTRPLWAALERLHCLQEFFPTGIRAPVQAYSIADFTLALFHTRFWDA